MRRLRSNPLRQPVLKSIEVPVGTPRMESIRRTAKTFDLYFL
jgi:hypothetical protein